MKLKDGEVIDEFSCFVNPEKHIPARVTEVTNITDEMAEEWKRMRKDKFFSLEELKDLNIVDEIVDL